MLVSLGSTPKFVVFCRSVTLAGFVYSYFIRMLAKLGEEIPKGVVGIYHSETLQKYKDRVFESLTSDAGTIKLVVATSSLGCGVNMKGVKFIVHFDPAFHTVDYYQQIGRAGSDSDQICHAILYSFPLVTPTSPNQ